MAVNVVFHVPIKNCFMCSKLKKNVRTLKLMLVTPVQRCIPLLEKIETNHVKFFLMYMRKTKVYPHSLISALMVIVPLVLISEISIRPQINL